MKSQSIYCSDFNQAYWPFPVALGQRRFQAKDRRSASPKLNNLLQTLISKLNASADLHVWETHTAAGETVWSAEDTVLGKTIYNVSESEMRVWLEERYRF